MKDENKKTQLIKELAKLRQRITELDKLETERKRVQNLKKMTGKLDRFNRIDIILEEWMIELKIENKRYASGVV